MFSLGHSLRGRSATACSRSHLAADPETVTVPNTNPVRLIQTVVDPERSKSSHVCHKALHDGESGRYVLALSTVRALYVRSAVD